MQPSAIGPARRWATLATTCLAVSLLAIDLTVMYLAIPALIVDLDPSATQLLWIADAYGFALGGLLVTMGNIGDRIGRKRLLLIGAVGFGAASLLTAYASSAELLIAARALLGVAGATIMPSTLSIIRNTFTDPRERTVAVGVWGGITAAGFALGPIVGGFLLDHFWWGSVFLINVPVMIVVLVAGTFILPESRNPNPGRLDLISVPLSVIGVVGIIYAIKEAADGGVGQLGVAVTGVVGAAAMTTFVIRQTRLAEPLIDVRLFRRAAFSASVVASTVSTFSLAGLLLNLSQYFQFVRAWSPLETGLAMLPVAGGAMIAGISAGLLVSLIGRGVAVALGLFFAGCAIASLSRISVASDYPTIGIALLALGVGVGLTFTITSDTVLATVPADRAGAAAAISETAYEVGGALGIAVLGSTLTYAYRQNLELPAEMPAEAAEGIREGIGVATQVLLAVPAEVAAGIRDTVSASYVQGLGFAAAICAGLLLVVSAFSLFALRRVPKVVPEVEHGDPPPARVAGRPE